MTIILSNFNRFKKNSTRKFAVKWILKIQPHLAYVATPPCETLMSAKQAINDKLQCSVASLHISRVVGLLITTLRKVYCSESASEKNVKIGEYLAKLQARP